MNEDGVQREKLRGQEDKRGKGGAASPCLSFSFPLPLSLPSFPSFFPSLSFVDMGNCFGSSPINHRRPSGTGPSSPPEELHENNIIGNGKAPEEEETITLPLLSVSGTPSPKIFTLKELKTATRNFRADNVLGEDDFGKIFKGWVDKKSYAPTEVGSGMAVTVKKYNPDNYRVFEEWQCELKSELNSLGKLSHPNLVKLLGYCREETQIFFVYECMQKGSLDQHLFTEGAQTLPWNTRLKIAIGAAQGLEFLHSSKNCAMYRAFQTSDILLDESYNAKLSNFGLVRMNPATVDFCRKIIGASGYASPEYFATGQAFVKSDCYGFGVVLLELLTGLRAFDKKRPTEERNLVRWAEPFLSDKKMLEKIMDPRLEHEYPMEGAMQVAKLISHCLENYPRDRPPMEEVLAILLKV